MEEMITSQYTRLHRRYIDDLMEKKDSSTQRQTK